MQSVVLAYFDFLTKCKFILRDKEGQFQKGLVFQALNFFVNIFLPNNGLKLYLNALYFFQLH